MISPSIRDWPRVKPVIDFLFPPLCQGCGQFHDSGDDVCVDCLANISQFTHPLCIECHNVISSGSTCPDCGDSGLVLFAYGEYTGRLQEVVVAFKFGAAKEIATQFGRLIAEQFADDILATIPDLLVPIPLHNSREYHRGYNQAALLADQLSRHLAVETMPTMLERHRRRRPQSTQAIANRSKNIHGVYRLAEPAATGRRVILIDDVVTSGATVREAKRIIEGGGHTLAGIVAIAWAGGRHA